MNEKKKLKRQAYLKRAAERGWEFRNTTLKKDHPFLFGDERKPLAIGFFQQLRDFYPDEPYNVLKMFVNEWTRTTTYIKSITKNKVRYNLDGSVASLISDEHHKLARCHVSKKRRKLKQKRKAKLKNES